MWARRALYSACRSHKTRYVLVATTGIGAYAWYFTKQTSEEEAGLGLSPTRYTKCIIESMEGEGDTRVVSVRVPSGSYGENATTTISSIFIKDSDIMTERPYTPLFFPPASSHNSDILKFWIKRYSSGEVARWILSKKPGDEIELRGPLTTFKLQDGQWDHVVMISGGTGLSPFFQLIQHIPSSPRTRFTLLHTSPECTPPPALIMDPLLAYAQAHPERLRVRTWIGGGRIGKERILEAVGTPENKGKVLFLVCGPEPMIRTLAGPYGRNLSQGPVGGVLGELGYGSGEVWKF